MNGRNKMATLVTAVGMACVTAYALVSVDSKGRWPSTWPKELEPFRAHSTTIGVANGTQETIYEISFQTREEFEKAWPFILTLKSKGAPIVFESSPAKLVNLETFSGVRIFCPSESRSSFADGANLKAGAPWPDSAKTASGGLPEYVVEKNGTWVPYAGPGGWPQWRARVEIALVMDGKIVSTNHLQIPAGTPIVDKRAKK